MVDVIGISFDKGKRIYYFSPNSLELNINDKVIVETERGKQYGKSHFHTGLHRLHRPADHRGGGAHQHARGRADSKQKN